MILKNNKPVSRLLLVFTIFTSTYFCDIVSCFRPSLHNQQALFFSNANGYSYNLYSYQSPFLHKNMFSPRIHTNQPNRRLPQAENQPLQTYQNNQQEQSNDPNYQSNEQQLSNPFEVMFEWRQIDYKYATPAQRQLAISRLNYIPENNLPLGVDRWRNRLFVTVPRWKTGVPATLSTIQLDSYDKSPLLTPYPSWDWQADMEASSPDCTRLMSVYRIWIDECGRLWVLDTGTVNATLTLRSLCLPKLIVFDLQTDEPILSYVLTEAEVEGITVYSNIIVDIRNGQCSDAYAYMTDVLNSVMTVFSLSKGRSWNTFSQYYYPNPMATNYSLTGIKYQWPTAVLGMSLSPPNRLQDRMLFFHPLASFTEYMVSTSVMQNETLWITDPDGRSAFDSFVVLGERGPGGQSTTSGIDRNNVQFYTLVDKDAIGCWNTLRQYNENNLDIIAQDSTTLRYPIHLKLDYEYNQNAWVLSDQFPRFTYSVFDPNEVNIRILRGRVRDAVMGTKCDQNI